jgi:hypothetical protein
VRTTWSAAEYVARVLVQTAQATGQTVRTVAAESFALTLWTWGELQQLHREAAVERMGERTDLAGLVAVGFHEPAKLQKAELRYLSAAGQLTTMLDQTRERLLAVAAAADAAQAHAAQGA